MLGTETAGSLLDSNANWPDIGPVRVIVPVADCRDVSVGRFTVTVPMVVGSTVSVSVRATLLSRAVIVTVFVAVCRLVNTVAGNGFALAHNVTGFEVGNPEGGATTATDVSDDSKLTGIVGNCDAQLRPVVPWKSNTALTVAGVPPVMLGVFVVRLVREGADS